MNPLIGIVIPNFDTADVLYLTGTARILIGQEASFLLPRTKLALKISVAAARLVANGLPCRASSVDYSPYNPPVQRLLSEKEKGGADGDEVPVSDVTARLTKRELLTSSISRFTFTLTSRSRGSVPRWEAGQYITLDFGLELDNGYAHMADDDPQSLNDDYVRTFTISSPPPPDPSSSSGTGMDSAEVQITVRKHGSATGFLWRWNPRVPLELPVRGFGGEKPFRMSRAFSANAGCSDEEGGQGSVFVAAGVGITPLLAQAPALVADGADFVVLWSISAEDLPLAVDSFKSIPGLAARTKLFITSGNGEAGEDLLRGLNEAGTASVERRRMEKPDLEALRGERRKFSLCTGPTMLEVVRSWLDGEEVVWEDFGY